MTGQSILELGPAEGVMTELLYPYYPDYTVVEGSKNFANMLLQQYPTMNVVHSYFEDFKPEQKYDHIILGHVLEHVDDPVYLLKLCKDWLNEGGNILSAVPNSHSIHRQAAVKMGMLDAENQLNETDKGVGHQRVYNYAELKNDFINAGLTILHSGGYWFKPVANYQIESSWTEEMIIAFMKLGEEYPDIAAEIYVVAG